MSIKLLFLNVKGLNNPFKRAALSKEAMSRHTDLLFVQETHFSNTKEQYFKAKAVPHIYYANTATKKRWVLLAIRESIAFRELGLLTAPNGRFIILISITK